MCGIVGILGNGPVAGLIVDALSRLEYRGYDSAGIATLEDGKLVRRRAAGKLKNLEALLAAEPLHGHAGVGHTRWATHGKPTAENAHPHRNGKVAVVHNGIIENFRALREELKAKGHAFESETDTEVVAHLVGEALAQGLTPVEAVAESLPRLKGAFALAFLFEGEDDLLIGARAGAPLVVGFGTGARADEVYLGSDALALASLTDQLAYLEEGDYAVLTRKSVKIFDAANLPVERKRVTAPVSAFLFDKGNYRHFMAKEIHEQPEVVGRTLSHFLDLSTGTVSLPFELPVDAATLPRLTISACGTAFMAGLVASYWFERIARLPVEIEVASEFRYREPPMEKGGLMLLISQSGETADTLASLRYAKTQGQKILSVVNVPTSTMARESDVAALTLAGPEIGVASTKAFTCQLALLACLALAFAKARGTINAEEEARLVAELTAVPGLISEALKHEPQVELLARDLGKTRDVLYLGRGTSYPLALEGALKLKEITYIHAEGYAAGELKHGPIALVDSDLPVIVLAPRDHVFEKTLSNVQEVAARNGRIILVSEPEAAHELGVPAEVIVMPKMAPDFSALVYAVPVQLLAYHTAVFMGKDADQPRNLAKSVTVE
ncbi:MAG: glutamine--fructose-6-phosphate transaminase (isomerizing) [Methylovirgula sp.]